MSASAEIRRNINRTTLTRVMNSPRVPSDVRANFTNMYATTRDAVILGVGVALGPANEPEFLGILPAARAHAEELLATYPHVRNLYNGKVFKFDRDPRRDRQREVDIAEQMLVELDTVDTESPTARRTAGVIVAKLYLASHGLYGTSHDTIDDRLEGAAGYTQYAAVMGRNDRWQLPYDLPEGFETPTEPEPAPVLTGKGLLDSTADLMAELDALGIRDEKKEAK